MGTVPGSRLALVIGNSAYEVGALRNPTAADDYEQLVLDYLDTAWRDNLDGQGYGPALHRQVGALNPGGSVDLSIELPANADIADFGVCDNECSNMDLVLLSQDGTVLGEDTMQDDVPLLGTVTSASTRYTLRVSIPVCSQGPCYYAFGVVRKPLGEESLSTPISTSPPHRSGLR